jgi:hypothetical protein
MIDASRVDLTGQALMTAPLAPDPCPRELRLQGISWIRYHDTNRSLLLAANTEAVNATASERAAIILLTLLASRMLTALFTPARTTVYPTAMCKTKED